jgi:hypothetical protein
MPKGVWQRTELRPILCGVVNPQDLDALFFNAINRDVGSGRESQLSGSVLASETAALGQLFEGTDSLLQLAHGRLAVMGMALFRGNC